MEKVYVFSRLSFYAYHRDHHQQPTTATISLSRLAYPLQTTHLKGAKSLKRRRSNLVAAELTQSMIFFVFLKVSLLPPLKLARVKLLG